MDTRSLTPGEKRKAAVAGLGPTAAQKRRAVTSAVVLAGMALGIYVVMMFKVFVYR